MYKRGIVDVYCSIGLLFSCSPNVPGLTSLSNRYLLKVMKSYVCLTGKFFIFEHKKLLISSIKSD